MAEELEIEIDAKGRVQVHVKGIKGRKCLDYVHIFEELLGPIKDQKITTEFYEAEAHTRTQQRLYQK